MNVVALIPGHQHPKPEVIVLQQVKILIRARSLNCGLFVHHARVVKRVSTLCEFNDFCIRLRRHSFRINGTRISCKFLNDTGADTYFWMCVEYSSLFFATIQVCNVITIHPSNQLIFAVLDAFIQCVAEAAVSVKTNNIKSCPHLLLLCSNYHIQRIVQGTITHQHKVICWEGLRLNALNRLLQIRRLLFVINRHQHRIL